MPQDEGVFMVLLVLVIAFIFLLVVPRCAHCGRIGNWDDVQLPGSHHEESCPLYRQRCSFCGFFGTKRNVARVGLHHDKSCRYFQGACQYCGVEGSYENITTKGFHHGQGCLLRPVVCPGCGVHNSETVLDESANIWNSFPLTTGEQYDLSTSWLSFSQNSISRFFHDGSSVFKPPQGIPKILACFHAENDGIRLFALNNRTLFNTIHNHLGNVIVTIVEKPEDWLRRFTGSRPWMCIKVRGPSVFTIRTGTYFTTQALRIPSQAFPAADRSACSVVLEVRNLINPKKDTFYNLLKDMSSDLDIRLEVGEREYARVRVNEDDVPLVRSMAKALAERMKKQVWTVTCDEVPGLRRYESPRD